MMHVAFVNEGSSPGVLGHTQVETAMRAAVAQDRSIRAGYISLPPVSRGSWLGTRQVPGLRNWDLDLAPHRWQAMRALQTRRAVPKRVFMNSDVVHVHSHSIALGLVDRMLLAPTVVSVDSTLWGWHRHVRDVRRYSKGLFALNLRLEREV